MNMFLKRLESIGFKSFAERINIEFVSGVTAVVGPNGSGKSNIIDAMRWVMGEQSAKSLRGQKMEDIIFQGSETRNPLNFAEVALILNNEDGTLPLDYQEINVTRRVYRSGESEFFINKQACRLKDIVDLFMDTGLGRESFSIIGQGKIDEILSSKAEERRAVFEEAAGVLKYKQRKNKAQFKLSETADNLDRVEDIIHEIEQQIGPLKKQATVAKQYKEMKAELKEIEISLLVTEIEQLYSEWKLLLKKIEENKLVEVEKKTAIQKREAKMTESRHIVETLDQKINLLQSELLKTTEQLEQYEGKRNVLKERFKHLKANKQKLYEDRNNKAERIADTKQLLNEEDEKLVTVNERINSLAKEINIQEQRLYHDIDTITEVIDDLKSDYIEFLNEQAVLQNEQKIAKEQLVNLKNESETNQSQESQVSEQREKLTESHASVQERIKVITNEISKKEQTIGKMKDTIVAERKKYETMQEKLYTGNEQIATLTSRKEMLEEMKENFQGFFYGVKEILQANIENRIQHIYGVVLDLIHVPEKYITVIDTVLGAQAQYVVVPNDKVARTTIQWLKKENKGRATFLPLESIKSRTIPEAVIQSLLNDQGFIGVASDLIQIEKRFKIVSEHLMGNVIVAETLQHANKIAKKTNRKYRVITLDGDIVFPGGSMSGGAKRKTNQTLFTRDREITTITDKLKRFKSRRDLFLEQIEDQQ